MQVTARPGRSRPDKVADWSGPVRSGRVGSGVVESSYNRCWQRVHGVRQQSAADATHVDGAAARLRRRHRRSLSHQLQGRTQTSRTTLSKQQGSSPTDH